MGTRLHGSIARGTRAMLAMLFAMVSLVVPMLGVGTAQGAGATYEVGPGKAYAALAGVPWQTLKPGDVVRIFYRSEPYREKIVLTESGLPGSPIRVVGVPGPNGEQPVIDGAGATSAFSSSLFLDSNRYLEELGVVIIYRSQLRPWGYVPSNIEIAGLTIRGSEEGSGFVDSKGASRQYLVGGSGIWARGNNLTFRGNTLEHNQNGIFVGSKGVVQDIAANILIDGNRFRENGRVGSFKEHHVYTEAVNTVLQANHFERTRAGSFGDSIKDRSSGLVVRYNWFEGGPVPPLDIEDVADNANLELNDPNYYRSFVYGNQFTLGQNDTDAAMAQHIRPGTVYFFNNTVRVVKDRFPNAWRTVVVELGSNAQTADVRNNVIQVVPAHVGAQPTPLYLSFSPGNLILGRNWISPAVQPRYTQGADVGTTTGFANSITNAANNPGFLDPANGDLRLAAGSQAIDAAGPLAPDAMPLQTVGAQYVVDLGSTARPVVGAAADLGAYEYGVAGGVPGSFGPAYQFPPLPAGASNGPPAPPPTPIPTPVPPTATATPAPVPPEVVATWPELIANGGFEVDTAGWTTYGGGILTRAAGGHSSGWTAQVAPPTASGLAVLDDAGSLVPAVQAGAKCVGQAWVRGTAGSTAFLRLTQAGGGLAQQTIALPDGDWHQVLTTLVVTAPVGAVDVKVVGAAGKTIQVDDVSLRCG